MGERSLIPTNTTSLSIAGVLKWLLIIAALRLLITAYQGIIVGGTSTGAGRYVGKYIGGREAVIFGWKSLAGAAVCLVAAWAIWRFWQSNED